MIVAYFAILKCTIEIYAVIVDYMFVYVAAGGVLLTTTQVTTPPELMSPRIFMSEGIMKWYKMMI